MDTRSFRIVLVALVALVLLSLVGLVGLTAMGLTPPGLLADVVKSGLAALVALLVKPPADDIPPPPARHLGPGRSTRLVSGQPEKPSR